MREFRMKKEGVSREWQRIIFAKECSWRTTENLAADAFMSGEKSLDNALRQLCQWWWTICIASSNMALSTVFQRNEINKGFFWGFAWFPIPLCVVSLLVLPVFLNLLCLALDSQIQRCLRTLLLFRITSETSFLKKDMWRLLKMMCLLYYKPR